MFQATSQFSLKFCITFQCHDIIPLKFSTWNITLWTKRAHQSTNFQIFECFNESSPNSSCQFWNHKVKVYSNFASLFSVMKDNFSVFFLSQIFILWTKRTRWSEIFKLWRGWMEIHQFPYVIFETTSQDFLNFASLFSAMRNNSSVLF